MYKHVNLSWLFNLFLPGRQPARSGAVADMNFTIDNATRHATALVQRPYQRRDGIYDEMVGLGTEPGAAWQPILSWFAHNDPNTQATFSRRVERLVFEHFYDPQRAGQGWHLDLMPLVLDTDAWSQIENAAIQRAVLFNHLLTDLYGAQVSFAEGLLPPTLIHSDRSFLRPLHGLSNSSQRLTFLALDFARDLAGNWRIIDAHTETPAGHGFALANRMVVADVLEDLFRKANATRIGPFYQALKNDLIQRAGSADPLIVVLAPGPKDSAFIGHAYMARYMGHKRVQGSDLRVMGNRVFLKTIDGLKEVDLIVRAIEGHKADPLELSEDSFDGPVGLVEACRQAPDVMVNALGTAVVENRGLSGYLNGLSQRFLGEDLLVPDTPRLWLGDAAAREQVLRELDQHVIHDAQEGTGSPGAAASGRMASAMTDAERAKLIEDITFNGNDLVAERQVGFATAPAWTHAGLRPEPYALRVYVAAIGSEFAVMPGGLALSVDEGATVALTSQRSRSRDVWVVSPTKSQPNISLVRLAKKNVRIQRRAQGLESRTADNLFWLGRYVEHADGTLRIIRQTLQRRAADLMALSASPRPIRALQAILQKDSAVPQAAGVNSPSDGLWSALHEFC
ncbi:MAG: circularly permuted type 2 ATP-grasp protein, partial [Pseudomonadota bacterium]